MKKSTIPFAEFIKFDFRIGEVIEATMVEGSKNLIRMIVDLGEDYGKTTILSGLAKFYTPLDLQGNKYIFLANLEPKKIMGQDSQGMLLVVDDPEKFELIPLDKKIKNGTVIR